MRPARRRPVELSPFSASHPRYRVDSVSSLVRCGKARRSHVFLKMRYPKRTLATICDFERLNDSSKMRIAVTATNVQTGDQVSFSNYVANVDALHYVTPRISPVTLTPEHILASGSLPPAFPMTVVDGVPYWDGGLFDNTSIEAVI